jgi:NADH-quinone oxidoreductase subunit F
MQGCFENKQSRGLHGLHGTVRNDPLSSRQTNPSRNIRRIPRCRRVSTDTHQCSRRSDGFRSARTWWRGFSSGRKWSVAAGTTADTRYVVCNAGEDEPGSFKDRILLEHRPHLVLEGIVLASRAIGAESAFLYLNETYESCFARITQAVEEARSSGFLDGLSITISSAPTVYVAGEDSAALEVLEGKAPKPRPKPPYPASSGLFGKPTVVNNVETLANVPMIVRNGARWFRQFGTDDSPGTMIFCLGDEVRHPGAYELPFGSSLRYLFEMLGGGLKSGAALKAILPGGPSCAFLTADQLDIPLDPRA